ELMLEGADDVAEVSLGGVIQQSPQGVLRVDGEGEQHAVLGHTVEPAAVTTVAAHHAQGVGNVGDVDVLRFHRQRVEGLPAVDLHPVVARRQPGHQTSALKSWAACPSGLMASRLSDSGTSEGLPFPLVMKGAATVSKSCFRAFSNSPMPFAFNTATSSVS